MAIGFYQMLKENSSLWYEIYKFVNGCLTLNMNQIIWIEMFGKYTIGQQMQILWFLL